MGIHDLINLTGKVALVTGASRGLGSAFAQALAEAGADLAVSCRHKKELRDTACGVHDAGREVLELEADITQPDQVQRMVENTVARFGRLDILVNNAGAMRINKPPEETTPGEWRCVINTNINGTFYCCREAAIQMKKQQSGKIINLSSKSGFTIGRHFHGGSYDVSKAGIAMLTKALAVEWAPYNINVNALAPGYYDTKPNREFFVDNPELYKKVIDLVPLKRLGDIRELSALVVCLASDISNYMTGTTILIDGGYNIW
jgi:NAD(P)-dependent dehydrogenase (short-subunit alcohol dehydrogenase family)